MLSEVIAFYTKSGVTVLFECAVGQSGLRVIERSRPAPEHRRGTYTFIGAKVHAYTHSGEYLQICCC